jgi:glycosyltransferase involved in cell wall biosynthesis
MNRTRGKPTREESRPRLLLLRTTRAFVARQDEACLRSVFDVATFDIVQHPRKAQLANLIRLSFWLIRHLPRSEGVFFRFADYFAFPAALLTRLFRRKLWIVTGGYESHCFRKYDYGVYTSRIRGVVVGFALRSATVVMPVHKSLYDGSNSYFDPPLRTGIKHLVPGMHNRVRVIYDGFDADHWTPGEGVSRERLVVCVASIPVKASTEARMRMLLLKGVPLLFEVARLLDDVEFAIIGPDAGSLPAGIMPIPDNVELTGHIPPEEVREWYTRAAVYMHPSLTEGLPGAVAEAMLCECVPVVSNVNGCPDLVGDTGFVVKQPDPECWRGAILSALAAGTGKAARRRIASVFSVEKRCAKLLDTIRP